jgi:hypothetical protein
MGEKESQVLPILMVDFAKLEYFETHTHTHTHTHICEITTDILVFV